MQRAHQLFIHTSLAELNARQNAVCREASRTHLVRYGAHRALGLFGAQQLTQKRLGTELGVSPEH